MLGGDKQIIISFFKVSLLTKHQPEVKLDQNLRQKSKFIISRKTATSLTARTKILKIVSDCHSQISNHIWFGGNFQLEKS